MSDPTEGQGRPRTPGRGVKIALGLSLAVNLLILGLVGGALLAVGPGRSGGDDPRLRTLGLGPFAIALSREDRAAVTDRIDRDALRAERRALGRSLVQLRDAIVAEPFDRAAAEAALEGSRSAAAGLQGLGHAALLDQVETMSAAERADLAGRLSRALRRMGGRDR
ncbi:periplasmic heavy metal sensor [Roseicyclus mahoneyensis]|uniref:Heavy-metal resistance protein n=1 Tax=Roseicyclus mahoneyensis TaxID=164332 RepID=A0A316GJ96_9RHOB|nr:periplasmic heavy metal sensor [Roseicyclus mahoneyensis]PWK60675.1 heavy-metal resistance protein [Roseicyclus mahoneyensis]